MLLSTLDDRFPEFELAFAKAGVHDIGAQHVARVVRMTYAIIIDGLDREQREKIDAALDGTDRSTGANRRKAMENAGLDKNRIDQLMRVSAAVTPEGKAAAKVAMLREKQRRAGLTSDTER